MPVADDGALDRRVPAPRRAGIEVTELSLHLPSLDEVFFTLTGARHADHETTATKEEAA